MKFIIRQFKNTDLKSVKQLALSLHPKWFDKNALLNIPIDTQINRAFIAELDNRVVGFIVFSSQDGKTRIDWVGVSPSFQRKGIGKQLLNRVVAYAKEIGSKKVIVETIVEQNPPDGSYDETIKFYLKQGFKLQKKYPEKHFQEYTFSKGILEKQI